MFKRLIEDMISNQVLSDEDITELESATKINKRTLSKFRGANKELAIKFNGILDKYPNYIRLEWVYMRSANNNYFIKQFYNKMKFSLMFKEKEIAIDLVSTAQAKIIADMHNLGEYNG